MPVEPMLLAPTTGTIPAGGTLSSVIDCRNGTILRMIMPTGWDRARLTFQVSNDNITFHDLYDTEGHEISVFVVPNSSVILKDPKDINYVRLRSGMSASPVKQSASRDLTIILLK